MEYLTQAEVKRLIEMSYETDRTMHMAILLSIGHGLRVSEMLNINHDDVDGMYLNIRALKNGVSRLEPLQACDDPLFNELLVAVHAHGCKQINQGRLFTWSRATADRKFKQMCRLAGIPSAKAHWHVLRHSTAMFVFNQTISLGSVKQALRHKSWSSSLVYLNESDSNKGHQAISHVFQEMSQQSQQSQDQRQQYA